MTPAAILGLVTIAWIVAALYGLWAGRHWGWVLALAYLGLHAVLYAGVTSFDLVTIAASVLLGAHLYSQREYYRLTRRSDRV